MYCFLGLQDGTAGRTEDNDHRNSRSYQLMLERCAGTNYNTHAVTYPHRQLLGNSHHWAPQRNGYGTQPLNIFVNAEDSNREIPSISYAYLVQGMLISKGLSVELVVKIMQYAHYKANRRPTVPHDPFHPVNREELVIYLSYCWERLVCCEMTTQALCQNREWFC